MTDQPIVTPSGDPTDRGRQVSTTLTAVEPRSAAKIGAAVGVCLFVAWMVAVALVYILLGATGVWDRINSLAGDLFGQEGVSAGMYFGVAAGVGVLEVVVTALFFPLGAVLYNAVADYTGGVRVTLGAGSVVEDVSDVEGAESTADSGVESTDSTDTDDVRPGEGAATAVGTAYTGTADTGTSDTGTAAGDDGDAGSDGAAEKGAAAAGWGSRSDENPGEGHRAP